MYHRYPKTSEANIVKVPRILLKSGINLGDILAKTGKYTFHNLRTRDMLSLLLNAQKPPFDIKFSTMSPVYDVSFNEMKYFFIEKAKEFARK